MQIDEGVSGTCGREIVVGVREICGKAIDNVASDLIFAARRRADRTDQVAWIGLECFVHRFDGSHSDRQNRASPAGMSRSERSGSRVGKKNGHTVSGLDAANHLRQVAAKCVKFFIKVANIPLFGNDLNAVAVYLPNRGQTMIGSQSLEKSSAIFVDILSRIFVKTGEIEAVGRKRRHAA